MWIEVTTLNGKFFLGTIYRPPNSPCDAWNIIDSNIEKACEISMHVILVGDINQDMLAVPNLFSNILSNYGLCMKNEDATHRLPNSSTLIDLIATNEPSRLTKTILTCPALSNHNGVLVGIGSIVREKSSNEIKLSINYGRADWKKITTNCPIIIGMKYITAATWISCLNLGLTHSTKLCSVTHHVKKASQINAPNHG